MRKIILIILYAAVALNLLTYGYFDREFSDAAYASLGLVIFTEIVRYFSREKDRAIRPVEMGNHPQSGPYAAGAPRRPIHRSPSRA